MNITIKNELKSFGSTSIYYYLCVDKKWPNIWLVYVEMGKNRQRIESNISNSSGTTNDVNDQFTICI